MATARAQPEKSRLEVRNKFSICFQSDWPVLDWYGTGSEIGRVCSLDASGPQGIKFRPVPNVVTLKVHKGQSGQRLSKDGNHWSSIQLTPLLSG